jgi:alpha-ketoglutarate-dependent 2,4-dichlorophenoxyacetate dioxygenase
MPLHIRPAEPDRLPDFAGEVSGIDLSRPIGAEEVAAIAAGMDKFAVLVFHDQEIDDEQQLAFSRHFGPLEHAASHGIHRQQQRGLGPEIADISNLGRDNEIMAREDRRRLFSLGNMLWHSDSSFKPTPAKYSLLHARIIPEQGGNTEFADMRAAWDALDGETKALCKDLVCMHSQIYSRALLGFEEWTEEERARNQPVPQRLVRRHPGSGRYSLFLSAHAGEIVGWPVPEARAFLRDLNEHATQRQFVYSHKWRVGDLVIWDNRDTMHRAVRMTSRVRATCAARRRSMSARRSTRRPDDDRRPEAADLSRILYAFLGFLCLAANKIGSS